MSAELFADSSFDPPVRGFIHRSEAANSDGLILTHGAGSNCQSPLLIAVADAFATAGFTVLRCDLPFRQARPHGPPRPGDAARDREGLKNATAAFRKQLKGRIFLGGHSYGGRQATMLAADEPQLVNGLLLLSYPLHPPRKPSQLRTQHLPRLQTPAMFVHGTRDPFGSLEEGVSSETDPGESLADASSRSRPRFRIQRKAEKRSGISGDCGRFREVLLSMMATVSAMSTQNSPCIPPNNCHFEGIYSREICFSQVPPA